MEQTGELDVARFNALRQALFSASGAELERWAEDVLGETLVEAGDADEVAPAKRLLARCRERSALDALYDAVARERSALRHAATTGQRAAPHAVAKSLGPYLLDARLGQGNSSVFRAHRGEELIRLRVRSGPIEGRRSAWQRFVRVARAASKLAQLGLPTLLDAGSYEGFDLVAHRLYDGVTVAGRVAAEGARPLREIWPLLANVLEALQALHDAGLAHGSLHEHNVLIWGSSHALLLDPGSHFLRARRPERDWPLHVLSSLAPEQLRGEDPSPQSDLYAFGVLLYRLLSGEGPYAGVPRHELFAAQLGRSADPLSFLTSRGGHVDGLDELGLALLDKDPRQRPQRVALVRQRLLQLTQASLVVGSSFAEQELDERTRALLDDPTSPVAAAVLEASVDQGADALAVADAFSLAAELLRGQTGAEAHHARLNLHAAALYELAGQNQGAVRAYQAVLAQEPRNETARSELERVLRIGAHHEDLIELWLAQLELESDPKRRARVLENVGEALENELDDPEQALLAYVQALAADPESDHAAESVERLAGDDSSRWSSVLEGLEQALISREPRLLVRMGRWYQQRLLRPDLALACFQAALACDPYDGEALLAAAVLLEGPLGQPAAARELYARIFAANAAHVQACRGVVRLCERVGDHASAVDCLERHAASTKGAERHAALCEAARLASVGLLEIERAIRLAQAALVEAPDEVETLRLLEALYRLSRRPEALQRNLDRQLELASSPRQNVEITLKLAAFAEQELLDEGRAASLLEDALLLEADNLPARRNLLRLYERLDRPARALEHYQLLLEYAPDDEAALQAMAKLADALGEKSRAATALDALARRAPEPVRRTELWLAAASLYEASAELHAAHRHYQQVLELEPQKAEAWAGLRRIALARRDTAAAIQLVDRELACTKSPVARARLYVELAIIHRGIDGEARRAEAAAQRALELDASSAEAHVVLADCAYEARSFADARHHYGRALSFSSALAGSDLARLHAFHASSLSELGEEQEALAAAEACVANCQDPATLLCAIEIMIPHGRQERALSLCRSLLSGDDLTLEQRARALSCQGEAQTLQGELEQAALSFELATELEPQGTRALEALVKLHRERAQWPALVDALEALARRTQGERRWAVLAEAGELSQQHLCDAARADRHYELVLSEHPQDHRVLVALLRLYGDTERWSELLPVIEALVHSLPAAEQSVPYLLTAARILDEKLNRPRDALAYLERALALAPNDVVVIERTQRLARAMGNLALTEELYGRLIASSLETGEKRRAVKLLEECYQLVSSQGNPQKTLALCEKAHALDRGNKLFSEQLTRLYRTDPQRYLAQSVELQRERLQRDATRPEPYQALFELYSSSGQLDAAWCLAQALVLLNLAGPEAEALFRRYQLRTTAGLSPGLSAADWRELVHHPEVDVAISEVFAIIEPALRRVRGSSPAKLGLKPQLRIDPSAHDTGVLGALKRLAPVFGAPLPELFLNKTQKRALALVRSNEPCLVLGPSALAELPPHQVDFTAGSHLLHFKPGYGLRHLLGTARALKASLLAALKLGAPDLPLASELADSVEETIGFLREGLEPEARRRLNELVAGLLGRDHALDLQHWLHGVDLMSDRLGFIACNDLGTALQMVRAAEEHSNSAPRAERCRELVRYAVDPSYIALRARLGQAIQASARGQSPAA